MLAVAAFCRSQSAWLCSLPFGFQSVCYRLWSVSLLSLPCCPLAPRWSFSDQNADGSALTKRDAKRRGRHQNRLLVSAVRDSGFLERLAFLPNPCCSAPNVKASSFLPGLDPPPPGAAVIPELPRLRRWTCPDPWKRGKRAVFHYQKVISTYVVLFPSGGSGVL